jgi:hypothetical protein
MIKNREGKKTLTMAVTVTVLKDMEFGKLNLRTIDKTFNHIPFCSVIPKGVLKVGEKYCLRFAVTTKNDTLIVRVHGKGYVEINKNEFDECFNINNKKITKETLNQYFYMAQYEGLSDKQKEYYESEIKVMMENKSKVKEPKNKETKEPKVKEYKDMDNKEKVEYLESKGKFDNLTKTDRMVIAFIKGNDMKEVEKQYSIDKSLKYKIAKKSEFIEKFFNKYTA